MIPDGYTEHTTKHDCTFCGSHYTVDHLISPAGSDIQVIHVCCERCGDDLAPMVEEVAKH